MTTEEKLKHFMDVTTQKVNEENAEALEEYENGLNKVFEDYKENATRRAELSLKLKEESLIKRKMPRSPEGRWKSVRRRAACRRN